MRMADREGEQTARGIALGEANALPGERVEVGCLDPGVAKAAEVAKSKVIGQENDHVGARRGLGCSAWELAKAPREAVAEKIA